MLTRLAPQMNVLHYYNHPTHTGMQLYQHYVLYFTGMHAAVSAVRITFYRHAVISVLCIIIYRRLSLT